MKYEIGEGIINRTQCQNGFHCLSGSMEDVCEIFNLEDHPIVVTDCPKKSHQCHYCKPFDGPQGFCKCPTRIELFIRYAI